MEYFSNDRSRVLLMLVVLALLAVGAMTLRAGIRQDSNQHPPLSRGGGQPGAQQTTTPVRSHPPGTVSYSFGLVDFPRSTDGGAFGINDSGVIVGGYNNVNLVFYPADHAFALKGNRFYSISYPGAAQTDALALNKNDEIVGMFVDSASDSHGFTLIGSTYTQLDCPGANFTVPLGISSSGDIVGVCNGSGFNGFFLSGGVYTPINVPGAATTWTTGINKAGVIVGYYLDSSGNFHGYIDKTGVFTTVDYPGYPNTYLNGITDTGLIVGGYGSPVTIGSTTYYWTHGLLYSGGSFSTFDVPFGDVPVTEPYAVNSKGEIVGGYVDSKGMTYGFYAKTTP